MHKQVLGCFIFAISLSLAHAKQVPPPSLEWHACPGDWFDDYSVPDDIANRLTCAALSVPLDHREPASGEIEVGAIRIRAEDPMQRRGAIFFNPGGPGQHPGLPLVFTAELFSLALPDDPAQGAKKAISRYYDLVAIVPRGLRGSQPRACESDEVVVPYRDITTDRSAGNIALVQTAAEALAKACMNQADYRYVNTEQVAHDMDRLRQAIGEETITYYGNSYGTWLGAWYGALYPQHVDRLFLDSSMDITGDFDQASLAKAPAAQRLFEQQAKLAATEPERYQLGKDPAAVVARYLTQPITLRAASGQLLVDPEGLLAFYTLGDWLTKDPTSSEASLHARNSQHKYSPDQHVNSQSQFLNQKLFIPRLFLPAPEPATVSASLSESVYFMVSCNDTASIRDANFWIGKGNEYAQRYPVGGANASFQPCQFWSAATASRPDFSQLNRIGKILMAQSQYDIATPMEGALRTLATLDDAHAVILDQSSAHGVLTNGYSACADLVIGSFLLDGRLPRDRITHCQADNVDRRHTTEGYSDPARARQLQIQLAPLLR